MFASLDDFSFRDKPKIRVKNFSKMTAQEAGMIIFKVNQWFKDNGDKDDDYILTFGYIENEGELLGYLDFALSYLSLDNLGWFLHLFNQPNFDLYSDYEFKHLVSLFSDPENKIDPYGVSHIKAIVAIACHKFYRDKRFQISDLSSWHRYEAGKIKTDEQSEPEVEPENINVISEPVNEPETQLDKPKKKKYAKILDW